MVYLDGKINNPAELDKVGTKISVRDNGIGRINDIVGYLQPSAMSADAHNLAAEMLLNTRELAGAGDAALGNINPEQASGAAIIAARDQAAIPLNRQIQSMAEFVEKLARLWYRMWIAFNPNGLVVDDGSEQIVIPVEELIDMDVYIRVDVSPANPFSKYARQSALDTLFQAGHLSFDEYVYSLDDGSNVPKNKLETVLLRRQEQADEQALLDQAALMGAEQDATQALEIAEAEGAAIGAAEQQAADEYAAEIEALKNI
jgi:hypothetical protein